MTSDGSTSLFCDDRVRSEIRDVLREGGHKPTGRGKPASEYLQRTVERPAINVAVDAGNVISFHSGIPISVVDLDRGRAPWSIAVVRDDLEYTFNRTGQSINLRGLLCLHDADGPCASPVKDSMRTKTRDETQRTLSVLWAARTLARAADEALAEYQAVLERCGGKVIPWAVVVPP